MDKIYLSEIDLDILHKLARGMSYKQVALSEGITHQTVKNRMMYVIRTFGANSMAHLVAILIASGVLYLPDLYQEIDVRVRQYRRTGSQKRPLYQLYAVRV